jgi:hypothetical protein
MSLVARSSLWFFRGGGAAAPSSSSSMPEDPAASLLLMGSLPNQNIVDNSSNKGPPGLVGAIAEGAMRFVSESNLSIRSLSSGVSIGAFGTPDVMTVGSNSITVNGNVFVRGGVETITSVELVVQDKLIKLAQPLDPTAPAFSDGDLSGAGIVVGSSTTTTSNGARSERSLRWMQSYRDGGGVLRPSRWRVGGGGLHIERGFSNNSVTVAYGFEIADSGDLEIVRHVYSNSSSNNNNGGVQQRMFVIAAPHASNGDPVPGVSLFG